MLSMKKELMMNANKRKATSIENIVQDIKKRPNPLLAKEMMKIREMVGEVI